MTLRKYTQMLRLYIISIVVMFTPLVSYSYTIPVSNGDYNTSTQDTTIQSSQHTHLSTNTHLSITRKKVNKKRQIKTSLSDNKSSWYTGYTNYKPPKVVIDLLNNPTKQNAIKYLEWQRRRTQKLMAAVKVLNSVEKELYTSKPKHLNDDLLVVFFSPECPHCKDQLSILKNVVKDYPSLDLVLYPVDNPQLAQQELSSNGLGKFIVTNDPIVERLDTSTGVPYLVFVSKSAEKVIYTHAGVMSYEGIMEHL